MLQQTARVGVELALEGREQLLEHLSEVQARLVDAITGGGGGAGSYNSLASPTPGPSPGVWSNPLGPYDGLSGPPQLPGLPQTLNTISIARVDTLTIAGVTNLVINGAVVGGAGAGAAGGGGGAVSTFGAWNPDAAANVQLSYNPVAGSFYNPSTGYEIPGAAWPGGSGGGAGGPGASGAVRALRDESSELAGLVGRITQGLTALAGVSFGTGIMGSQLAYGLSGGDMTRSQAAQMAWKSATDIPGVGWLLGAVMNPIVAPLLDKTQTVEKYNATLSFMGMNPLPTGVGFATSDTALNLATGLALSGIEMPAGVMEAFTKRFEGPDSLIPSGRDHFLLDPNLRPAFAAAVSKIRSSPAAMAAYGYGQIGPGGEEDLTRLIRLSEGMLEIDTARMIGKGREQVYGTSYGGKLEAEAVLRAQRDFPLLEYERTQAQIEARRMGTLFGAGAGEGLLEQEAGIAGRQAGAIGVQRDYVRRWYQDAYAAGDPGAESLRQNLERLETQVRRLETDSLGLRVAAVEERYRGGSRLAEISQSRFGIYGEVGEAFGLSFRERSAAGTFGVAAADSAVMEARDHRERLERLGIGGTALAEARLQEEQAGRGAVRARANLATLPVDLSLQRAESYGEFKVSALQGLPGTYGDVRGSLVDLLGVYQQERGQIGEMRERQRRQGLLTPESDFAFQERMQQLALKESGALQQLSHGWESRVVGMMLGNPGTFNLEGRGMSWRDAVLGGVTNPHFGSRQDTLAAYRDWAGILEYPLLPGFKGFPNRGFGNFGVQMPGGPGAEGGYPIQIDQNELRPLAMTGGAGFMGGIARALAGQSYLSRMRDEGGAGQPIYIGPFTFQFNVPANAAPGQYEVKVDRISANRDHIMDALQRFSRGNSLQY